MEEGKLVQTASLPLKLPQAWHAPEDKQVWFIIERIWWICSCKAGKLTIVCGIGVSAIKFSVDRSGDCDLFFLPVRCRKLELKGGRQRLPLRWASRNFRRPQSVLLSVSCRFPDSQVFLWSLCSWVWSWHFHLPLGNLADAFVKSGAAVAQWVELVVQWSEGQIPGSPGVGLSYMPRYPWARY